VVVNSHTQGDFGFILADNIAIHEGFDLHGSGQLIGSTELATVIDFHLITQQLHTGLHTFVANANTGSGDKAFCLGFAFSAERTVKTAIFFIRHESVTAFPID
jgi:hypothetical protein